jgi:hypothetical protein
MEKPLTVARQEFAENIVSVINDSGLPAFVALEILKNCEAELSVLSQKQYEADKAKYEESLQSNSEEE